MRRVLIVAVLTFGALCVGITPAAADDLTLVALTATPNTGLTDGQTVELRGTAFVGATMLFQCATFPASQSLDDDILNLCDITTIPPFKYNIWQGEPTTVGEPSRSAGPNESSTVCPRPPRSSRSACQGSPV